MGYKRPPTAMMVTPEPPVNVVKRARTAVTITARPPGIQPSRERKKRSRRADAPLSARREPQAASNGIAGRVGDALRRYYSAETAEAGLPSFNKNKEDKVALAHDTGGPTTEG